MFVFKLEDKHQFIDSFWNKKYNEKSYDIFNIHVYY
jgi:hypothetical protein